MQHLFRVKFAWDNRVKIKKSQYCDLPSQALNHLSWVMAHVYYGLQTKNILTKETIDVYNITGKVNEQRLFKTVMQDHNLPMWLVCEQVLSAEIFQSIQTYFPVLVLHLSPCLKRRGTTRRDSVTKECNLFGNNIKNKNSSRFAAGIHCSFFCSIARMLTLVAYVKVHFS